MSESDRQSDGRFGFARGAEIERASVRLVYSDEQETSPEAVESRLPGDEKAGQAASPGRENHWIVKPKPMRPVRHHAEPDMAEASPHRGSFDADQEVELPPAEDRTDLGKRRWLALGLAGVVYLVGIAGMWSMVQTFDETTPAPLAPAGDSNSLPPIEETIDVRDARLDGPFIPKFKPGLPLEADDVAASDLQKKS